MKQDKETGSNDGDYEHACIHPFLRLNKFSEQMMKILPDDT